MEAALREALKQRHRFSDWAGKSTVPKDRGALKFTLSGDEVPGLHLERIDRRDAAQPPRRTVFLRRGDSDAVVRIDVFECASTDAAHEHLIDALNEFESGGIGRRTDANFGDVTFGTDSIALFARANLVILVRKATPQKEPVTPIAQAIDALIVSQLR